MSEVSNSNLEIPFQRVTYKKKRSKLIRNIYNPEVPQLLTVKEISEAIK